MVGLEASGVNDERSMVVVKEMSKYFDVSSDAVYRWISARQIPGHKIGRLWKFKKDEVDEWVKSGGARRTKSNGEE